MPQDPNPLSVFYMEQALEERPSKNVRLGPRIGGRFLPMRSYPTPRVVWEKVRSYSPIAGAYALEDLPDTMDKLDFETYQSDLLHWGTRMTISAKEIMFLRYAGQTQAVNAGQVAPTPSVDGYGTGPAADEARARDAEVIAENTQMMNEAMDNVLEYLRIHALQGRIIWPPRDEDGNALAAAEVPLSMGRQKLNHPVPFAAATGTYGAFHQAASTLTGITGGVAATQKKWNAADANAIQDMAVIADLMEDRFNLVTSDLLVICAKRVFVHLAKNSTILDWILGKNRDRQFMTVSEQRDFIQTEFEWTVEFYQSKWEYVKQDEWATSKPTVHQVPFMDYGTVLIIPRPEIQEMGVVATCPAPGPAYNWQAGKYLWMVQDQKPPWGREMGMGAYWWPLVFDVDLRFRLDAWS